MTPTSLNNKKNKVFIKKIGDYIIYGVLLSGGLGTRMKLEIPKQFIKINNKPILAHCIEKFINVNSFKKIIVSSPNDYLKQTKELVNTYFPNNEKIVVIVGGKTRQETLMASLKYIKKIDQSTDITIINHDAARIFVSEDLIKKCIDYTDKFGSSSPIIPSTDVIIETNGDLVEKIPNRYDLFHVQTPQGFKLNEYLELINKLSEKEIEHIHEIIKVYHLNNKFIKLFDGEKSNFKITTPIDIKIAETLLKEGF